MEATRKYSAQLSPTPDRPNIATIARLSFVRLAAAGIVVLAATATLVAEENEQAAEQADAILTAIDQIESAGSIRQDGQLDPPLPPAELPAKSPSEVSQDTATDQDLDPDPQRDETSAGSSDTAAVMANGEEDSDGKPGLLVAIDQIELAGSARVDGRLNPPSPDRQLGYSRVRLASATATDDEIVGADDPPSPQEARLQMAIDQIVDFGSARRDGNVDPPIPPHRLSAPSTWVAARPTSPAVQAVPRPGLWRATPVFRRISDWPGMETPSVLPTSASGGSKIVLVQATQPAEPVPPPPPSPPGISTDVESQQPTQAGLGWLGNVLATGLQSYIDVSPASSIVDPTTLNAAFLEVRTDAGSLLENLPGADVGFRTPIYRDPMLKGRRNAQAPARGSYWFPARQDLDTLLSKIDSRIVREFNTINGPYSVLYGPGLAFFDVRLLEAPRFDSLQNYGSTSIDYKSNGDQWYGRQSVWGGDEDWGYRVGYGMRTGSDYESGDGTKFPSSYKSRMLDLTLGGDLTPDSRIDVTYLRLDQTDVEFPGQYFDINFLVTDAYEVTYTLENQPYYDRLAIESWYNRTRFAGDNLRAGKRRLLPSLDALGVVSTTDVDAMSTGYRLGFTWEETLLGDVTAGSDLRYLTQSLNEFNALFFGPSRLFPIPPAHSSNPGLFVQSDLEVSERMSLTAGARVDWVSTNAQSLYEGTDYEQVLQGEFDQHFRLWAAFLTGRYELSPHWRLDGGFGHSMRPPTMTDLYAAGPFISAFPQKIFTTLWGNPHLASERMWQIDLGLSAEYERFRAGLSGYYSWVNDYITLDLRTGSAIPQYGLVNTDLATLSGFDLYADYDVSCALKAFSTLSYVEGRDHTRDDSISQLRQPGTPRSDSTVPQEPLPVMPPLEARVGVVIHEPIVDPRWSVEIAARIVDAQDRIATSLLEEPTAGYTVFDLRAYAQLFDELMLIAGVENFTDRHYRTYYDTRSFTPAGQDLFRPGISFYFGGQLDY